MTTTNERAEPTVVVQLMHGSRQLAYRVCTYAEARERLTRETEPGFRYTLPLWQFGPEDAPVSVQLAERAKAVAAIFAGPKS